MEPTSFLPVRKEGVARCRRCFAKINLRDLESYKTQKDDYGIEHYYCTFPCWQGPEKYLSD